VSDDKAVQIPVIRISMQRSFDDGSVLSMETYAAQDAPAGELSALMDKITQVSDRQALHADLSREEKLLYNQETELERMVEGLKKCDERAAALAVHHTASQRRGDFKLPETEVKAREGLKTNIEMMTQKRDQLAERVEELRTILGKGPVLKAAE